MSAPTFTLRAAWPILDDSLTLREAIEEAAGELGQIAARTRARIAGPPRWTIRAGAEEPGLAAYALVLVCEAPAERQRTSEGRMKATPGALGTATEGLTHQPVSPGRGLASC